MLNKSIKKHNITERIEEMKRIDKLTPEQEAQMKPWSDKWIEIGLRTGDADFETFDKYMPICYQKAGGQIVEVKEDAKLIHTSGDRPDHDVLTIPSGKYIRVVQKQRDPFAGWVTVRD